MNVGNALKYYRKLSEMTQVQVAETAGINDKYYGEIERGESSPTIDRLELISYSLGVDIQQLVGYAQLIPVKMEVQNTQDISLDRNTVHAYCNCCGMEFVADEDHVVCPQCGCEYSDENEYIEIYG
jgi:transcriptional regulator with XRE-family HTH domain